MPASRGFALYLPTNTKTTQNEKTKTEKKMTTTTKTTMTMPFKHWEFWADGSVRPYNRNDPSVAGGFAGCAWVMRDPERSPSRFGECWALPVTRDVTSTELTGIMKALDFAVDVVHQLSAAAIADLHITVRSDCKDAVDEVRYAYGPQHGLIPLSGGRDGYIQIHHPTLTHRCVNAIRSLEARGIVARVVWEERMATDEAIRADAGARKRGEMRRMFSGTHGPRRFPL
ncbi:hypothetical protein CB0940_10950 [Cercospora beticola]|uniref:RNase H type-1 domain-containing protein n=1 Tax=Cercospora beticola TaxID=122368 RepID=A0A2G5HCZ9_CERBT|nr:hypothetical protein CB0940_10950 [Cercospora beticola]PIA90375.1 hypothetical protein CB0940_10950 [Cercospora beticola]WPB07704.1 hypothetical protein RHO25_012365 [Cercospora beticola]